MSNQSSRSQDNGVGRAEGGEASDPPVLDAEEIIDCKCYERLIQALEIRTPTAADLDRLADHEAACLTGEHSEAGVEEALGLPPGALRHGSPQHELPSPSQLIGRLIKRYLKTEDFNG